MKIITIVVTYNATKWIDKCFGSLMSSSIQSQIHVVDNNSTDNTVELIRNNFPQVNIHEVGENLGFGKANNLGFKIALEQNVDYVFLLNQDAWIEIDTIEKLIRTHKKNEDYGVMVPLQMNGSGNLIDSLFMEYTLSDNRELLSSVFKGSSNTLYEVNFANAACWLMPISLIQQIGGFDPLFPHYGEDDDYLNRVKHQKYKVGLEIATTVFHDREMRSPNTDLKTLINNSFTRELILLKKSSIPLKSKVTLLKDGFSSALLYLTSGFNRYYLGKIIALYKIFKIYSSIKEHRREESKLFPHYL